MTLLTRIGFAANRVLGPLLLAGALLSPGCATNPKNTGPKYVFYPPAPEKPRLQFLVSFSDEADLGRRVSKFATFVTGEVPPSQPIVKPYGVALVSNVLYVCDTGTRSVGIIDLVAKTMRQFAPPGMGSLATPIGISVDADGTRYIADTGRSQVLIYGADETFRGAISEGNSLKPTGLALWGERLYVSDLNGHCVRVYEKASRKPLFTIPRNPDAAEEQEPGKLFMPVNLAIDGKGQLYVSDMAACRVQVYDSEGKHLRGMGTRGDLPGQFARPKGVDVDREGRVYVVDAASQVCQIFDRDGKLLIFFGEPNSSPASLDLPAGVTLDYAHVNLFQRYVAPDFVIEHLVIITNQLGPRKISIYALGHKK